MPLLRRASRGAAYVEVLVIVGVVLVLGFAAVMTLGRASSAQADKQAECVKSFSCGPGGAGAAPGSGPLATTVGAPTPAGTPGTVGESKSLLSSAGDVAKGFFVDGLWGTVTGVVSAVAHPINTVEGLAYVVAHPINSAVAIKDGVVKGWNENPERLVGNGIFQVLTLPIAATKGAKAAEIATDLSEVANAAKAVKTAKTAEELAVAAKAAKDAEEAAAAAKAVREAEDAAKVAKNDCVGGVCASGSCFGPGTPVATPDGDRAIETIAEGDLVLARDPATGITAPRRVERLYVTPDRAVLELGLERADGSVETMVVTPEHPFFHEGEGFVPIASLSPGDLVASAEGHLRIRSMASLPTRITVYNFEVETAHTYFVGESAAWVHNTCVKPPKLGDEVLVPRSDGTISGGKIIGEAGNGKVIVEVPAANGQVGTKVVSRDSLVTRRAVGDEVSIPRSDGSTSVGTIERTLPDGRVVVTWNEKGQVAEKTLPESALKDAPGARTADVPPVKFGDPYVAAKDGYVPDRIFSDWIPPKGIAEEGWKIHVSADPARSYDVANRILPELREMGVPHKVMTDPAAYAQMTGGQTGKFITIYPNTAEEAAAIAKSIDTKLADLKGTAPVISGELPLGSSGSVYTRYGGFTKSTVTNPATGREVGDIRGQMAPPWVKNPFHP